MRRGRFSVWLYKMTGLSSGGNGVDSTSLCTLKWEENTIDSKDEKKQVPANLYVWRNWY